MIALPACVNIGVAAAIKGTIPFQVKREGADDLELRVGNPSGIIVAGSVIKQDNETVEAVSAVMYRTFRPLMIGKVLV